MSSDEKRPLLSCDDSLLDKVDKLRELGMQEFFPLPQIAVVGDQSSGKSTLLEYISGVTFPKDAQFCTCFVTEVTMRPEPVFSAEILLNGKVDSRLQIPQSADKVADVINEAKKLFVGENEKSKIYDDVLTVRLCGPELSSLTLVDLPGYIHTHSNGQDKNNVEKIKALCEKYLKSPSTIILAVMPANRDFETNVVIQHIRKFDAQGERTLCVLTKPDLVDPGTEWGVLEILSGSKMTLSRGYHIVKNRNYEDCQAGVSREATARKEANFFAAPPWSKVDPWQRGVNCLVAKLSNILTSQVQKEFPGIRRMIKERKANDEELLKSLGAGVETDSHKIRFVQSNMTQITRQLKYLVDRQYSAVEIDSGCYIRAHVQRYNQVFRQEIMDITTSQLQKMSVATIMRRSRGRELPGMFQFDPLVVLFRSINHTWSKPTRAYVENICGMVQTICAKVIKSESPEILLDYISEGMSDYLGQQEKQILADVDEIRNDESTPFTCQPFAQLSPPRSQMPEPMHCVASTAPKSQENSDNEPDSTEEHFEMREILRNYCKIAVERYVDAVCLYAIERNLFKRCEARMMEFFNTNRPDLSCIRESSNTRSLRQSLPDNISKFNAALREF